MNWFSSGFTRQESDKAAMQTIYRTISDGYVIYDAHENLRRANAMKHPHKIAGRLVEVGGLTFSKERPHNAFIASWKSS